MASIARMRATPPPPLPLPLLRRIPPGAWTVLAWVVGTGLSLVARVRLPGEGDGSPFHSVWSYSMPGCNQVFLLESAVLTAVGSWMLRRWVLPAFGVLLVGAVAGAMVVNSSEINLLQFLAVDAALCHIAAARRRRVSVTAAVLALGVLLGYAVARVLCGFAVGTSTELAVALTVLVAWLLGDAARRGAEHGQALRAQAAAQAVIAERLRISRELHDMVAHSIGIIALQAGAAGRVIETQPAAAREALGAIEGAGREALSGLRRMLGALREADATTTTATAAGVEAGAGAGPRRVPPGPAEGLADVERLAAATTAAGVRVEVCWRGVRRALPADIELSAYRIIQESVTNVVRHADAAWCRVSIDHSPEALSIEVLDHGDRNGTRGGRAAGSGTGAAGSALPGSAGAAGGFGLVGMRERAALLHGEFAAGPRPGGGFRVAARIPVPAGAR